MSSRPGWGTYLRDTIIFIIGAGIVIGQTGFPFLLDAPPGGPSIPALVVGALFCNGPVVLAALALRFGTGSSGQPQGPASQVSPSGPSPAPSSGGE